MLRKVSLGTLAVAGLLLLSRLAPSPATSPDPTIWDREIAQLELAREHALPGTATHYKLGHKIERLQAHKEGRPAFENPDEFARILYERTVPADRQVPGYEPSYRLRELDRAVRVQKAGTPLPWMSRGPGNVAGRARGIVVDPDDPTNSTWYIGSVGGGVWKTTDAGQSWTDLTPDFPVLAVSALAMAPSDPDVLYAGTGESFYNVDTINGNGILKSTDRGLTWIHLASTIDDPRFNNVARIVVHASNPEVVLAATTMGRYKEPLGPKSTIFKSTNGGATWNEVYIETDIGSFDRVKKVQQIVAHPADPTIYYATIDEKGILKSTDTGESWVLINGGITDFSGRFELAISPANPNYLYACAEGASHSELWVSTNGGATWARTAEQTGGDPNWLGAQGWYDNTIVAHPTLTNVVYLGGIRLWQVELLGITQRRSTLLDVGPVHVDQHNLVVLDDGGGAWRLLNVNDGGVGLSGSQASSWSAPIDGMITTQFYGVDKRPGRSAYIGGMQDNGTWRSDLDPTALDPWTFQIGGDGYETHWHFDDPLRILGGYQFNGLQRSLDGGDSWNDATGAGTIDTGSGAAPFITKIASSHARPDAVYAVGSQGVWHSFDFAQSWGLASIVAPNWDTISSFTDVRVSEADPDIVWAGMRMDTLGRINVSTDAGLSFGPTTNYPAVVMGGISGLATHPTEPNTAYALFSFAGRPKVLRTADLGATWEDISGFGTGSVSTNGFPDVAVYDLVVFPNDPDRIWVGTEIGLFESLDDGASWSLADNGLPAVGVWRMRIVEDEVVLGTHGRGVWSVTIPELLNGQTFKPLVENFLQTPLGPLSLELNLRSEYDSTQVWVDGLVYTTLPANAAKDLETLSIPVTEAGLVTAFARGFKDGEIHDSLTQEVDALLLAEPVSEYVNDFNSSAAEFLSQDGVFSVGTDAGFSDASLHSSHPYPVGQTSIVLLTQPIRVAQSDAFVRFDEIVLVEPGEPGTVFGDSYFWDYVIVEGSLDGVHWIPLGPGYDSREDPTWESAYYSGIPGDPSMYRTREYDLLTVFQWRDVVLLRWRLYSDGAVTSWGWAVDNVEIQVGSPTAVDGGIADRRLQLRQNVPNPFNPSTTISWSLPRKDAVSLRVYDLRGRLVATLVEEIQEAGPHSIAWDGTDARGQHVASGTYLYRLKAGEELQQRKMTLVK